jgi:hypothetical protein
VKLDGLEAKAQSHGDVLVRHPSGNENEYLVLPRGQRGYTAFDVFAHFLASELLSLAINPLPDSRKELFVVEWLWQKMSCSGAHCFHRHGHVSVSRDEHDGSMPAAVVQLLLQLQSALIRELHVKDKARRRFKRLLVQKIMCRPERYKLKPGNAK